MGDKNLTYSGPNDDVKGEEIPCSNIYEITQNVAKSKTINIIGGSTSKGSLIKGGQNGEA